MALFKRRKIEKRKFDRALDLQRPLRPNEHARDMGFVNLGLAGGNDTRTKKKVDDGALWVAGLRHRTSHDRAVRARLRIVH